MERVAADDVRLVVGLTKRMTRELARRASGAMVPGVEF